MLNSIVMIRCCLSSSKSWVNTELFKYCLWLGHSRHAYGRRQGAGQWWSVFWEQNNAPWVFQHPPNTRDGAWAQWLKSFLWIDMEDLGARIPLLWSSDLLLESQATSSHSRWNGTVFVAVELRSAAEPFTHWDCPSWASRGLPLPLPFWSFLWWTLPWELGGYPSIPGGLEEGDARDVALHCSSLRPMLVTWH